MAANFSFDTVTPIDTAGQSLAGISKIVLDRAYGIMPDLSFCKWRLGYRPWIFCNDPCNFIRWNFSDDESQFRLEVETEYDGSRRFLYLRKCELFAPPERMTE